MLPLDAKNWITCGNALRLDWLSVCPPTGTSVKLHGDDLFNTPLDQAQIDFENEGGETYICGNPPYLGSKWQTDDHKTDLKGIFDGRVKGWKSLDYVAGWLMKAADYGTRTDAVAAFVSTNSICQGQQVPILWPLIFSTGHEIPFAHTSFKWANLASHNAGVTVVIVGISNHTSKPRHLFAIGDDGATLLREADNINAYLVAAPNIEVDASSSSKSGLAQMQFGNHPYYGAALIFSHAEAVRMCRADPRIERFVRPLYGSQELIDGAPRACLWIVDTNAADAASIPAIEERLRAVTAQRKAAKQDKAAQALAETPYRFRDQNTGRNHTLIVPRVSSENRSFIPVGLVGGDAIVQDAAFSLYDAALWNLAIVASRIHLVWIATVCGKLETRYRYSNTLGWNTFPVPALTEHNKADLTRCAEDILIAREAHFPATIAELYNPANMPENLRRAHEANDEVLERIYIGRRFKNDTERLEKLFELYTKMTQNSVKPQKPSKQNRNEAA